jgi:glycosyltransferase involved in cell wall biosynthesis
VRVAQVSCWLDPQQRPPAGLLEAWPTLVDVATATAETGVDITVLQAAHTAAEIDRDGVRFIFVESPEPGPARRRSGPWTWPMPERLAERLCTLRPDIVHFHGLSFPRHAAYLKTAAADARFLVQDHADHPPPRWRRPLHRHGLAHVDAVAFTAAAQASPFLPLLPPAVLVVEVPESSSRFTPGDRAAARNTTGLHGDPCLVWLGHLDANKDPLCILDALSIAAGRFADVQLWMAYRGTTLLEQVHAHIDGDAVLRERVHLLGDVQHDTVQSMLRAADFLVQGSHAEGSGYAVIEALACGAVPLVTEIPSFRVLTANGRYGALSPAGDAASMAMSWIDWAGRDRTTMRNAALHHFASTLSFAAVGAQLAGVYETLLAE